MRIASLIDGRTDTIVKTLKSLGTGAGRMAVSPDGKWAASSGEGDVCVIDLTAMTIAARHKVGVNPFGGGLRSTVRQ
jgi:hypothetical protein